MIYLDNAATSFPKPASVSHSIYKSMTSNGGNPGRGGHKMAVEAMDVLFTCREKITNLIGGKSPERLIFTSNATEGMNLLINGLIEEDMNVIISPFEHNAVLRPLNESCADISVLPANKDGTANVTKIPSYIKENTKLVIINHVSNVTGVINDIEEAAKLCKMHGIPLVIDGSQSIGTVNVDIERLHASIVFPGHKSLMGPQGTGCVYIAKNITPRPLITGGTGSNSESFIQPGFLPDYYESGTRNMPGITGLLSAVEFIEETKPENILAHEQSLAKAFIKHISALPDVDILFPGALERTGVVSFVAKGCDCVEIGNLLDENYGIAVRSGLHCAPLAHKTCGTFETGTVRVSPGWFNTICDMEYAAGAIEKIIKYLRHKN